MQQLSMEVKDIENNPELLKKIVEHVKFGKTGKTTESIQQWKLQATTTPIKTYEAINNGLLRISNDAIN